MSEFDALGYGKAPPQRRSVQVERCDYCRRELEYPSKGNPKARTRIIGRSTRGGYLCNECKEPGWRGPVAKDFAERHAGDMWGSLLRASKEIRGPDEGREFLRMLREQAKAAGGVAKELPYDKRDRLAS